MGLRDVFTKKNGYFLIIFMCAAIFGFDYNILHGFFPHFSPKKNVSTLLNGLLYSEYEVIILVLFPVVGKLAPMIGGERVLYLGTFILGVSSILFGMSYFLPAGYPFIAATFVSRAVGSVGAAFGYVVNPALIATLGDSDKVCTLIGTLESILTGGIMLGPTIGSVLYQYGGYLSPFIFIGAVMITLSLIVFLVFPNFKSTTIIEGKLSIFITSLNFWVNMSALFMVNFTVGFQSACFFLYCKEKFQMSPLTSSLAFLGDAVAFVALSPFVGMLNDAFPTFLPHSICLGLLLAAIAMCFMGPLPFLGIKPHIAISVVSTIAFGVGDAFVFSPVFTQLLNIALNCGLDDDFKTYSIVSSCHGFFGVLALALGPTVGVIMYNHIGYGYSCGIIALFMLAVIITILISRFTSRILDMELDHYCRKKCCSVTASNRMHLYEYKPLLHHDMNPNIKKNIDVESKSSRLKDTNNDPEKTPILENEDPKSRHSPPPSKE